MSEPAPEIKHSVFIRAPREKVWSALTTPQGLDGWWGTRGSEIDLAVMVLDRTPEGRGTDWGPELDYSASG